MENTTHIYTQNACFKNTFKKESCIYMKGWHYRSEKEEKEQHGEVRENKGEKKTEEETLVHCSNGHNCHW